MYKKKKKEMILDKVDKLSLSKCFVEAFEFIKNEVFMPFDFEQEELFKKDLKQLVKINALKHGIIMDGVFN